MIIGSNMANRKDITGNKYNRLTALEFSHKGKKVNYWKCMCDCGKTTTVHINALTSGGTKSCGCLKEQSVKEFIKRATKHGLYKIAEYKVWQGMKQRCNNTNHSSYKNYGGRGIKVCDRWNSFVNFINDMGEKPAVDLSIDRIDNDGDYEPNNCRWADAITQNNNQRGRI